VRKQTWVVPEKRDEKFSNLLIRKIGASAKSFGISAFSLEIKEKYVDEAEPHYHISVSTGPCSDMPTDKLKARYSAKADGKEYAGIMNIVFKSNAPENINQLMVMGALFLYDEYIRKYYPEWKTEYWTIDLPIPTIPKNRNYPH